MILFQVAYGAALLVGVIVVVAFVVGCLRAGALALWYLLKR